MDKMLINVKQFLEADIKIKNEAIRTILPDEVEHLDKKIIMDYKDNLYKIIEYAFSELKRFALGIYGEDSTVLNHVCDLEREVKDQFNLCGFDLNRIRWFHKKYIQRLDPKFVDAVKEECIGYNPSRLYEAICLATSINEVLHFLHMDIMNDNIILQEIKPIKEKINQNKEPIYLRGGISPIFDKLFEEFPVELYVGETNIVVIDENKAIVLVRDRGHAVSFEIIIKNKEAWINYCIQKIINVDMINSLPGVREVPKNIALNGKTSGMINTTVDDLGKCLFGFISKVPTDDLISENERDTRRI